METATDIIAPILERSGIFSVLSNNFELNTIDKRNDRVRLKLSGRRDANGSGISKCETVAIQHGFCLAIWPCY